MKNTKYYLKLFVLVTFVSILVGITVSNLQESSGFISMTTLYVLAGLLGGVSGGIVAFLYLTKGKK